ncbi:MAG: hypothetical protein JKY93_01790 [Gammaproteobacteria bacterium]|nr:hypothetical protein [Gammaproteobacteria bacterium]
MNPLIIPLIGPIINGLVSLFAKPKEFAKESVTTKTTKAGAAIAIGTLGAVGAVQTEEQAITAFVGGVLSIALMLYKKHKAEK